MGDLILILLLECFVDLGLIADGFLGRNGTSRSRLSYRSTQGWWLDPALALAALFEGLTYS